jgi:DNA-binding MarR family transcriptional regulator
MFINLSTEIMTKNALTDADYAVLADFRRTLRRFLAFSEARAAEIGLTPQQHQALLVIRAAPRGQAAIGHIAEWLMLKPHSASGLVDRLEALGLLERQVSPHDRRRAHVVLTPEADTLLARLSLTHREELRRLRPMLAELLARIE